MPINSINNSYAFSAHGDFGGISRVLSDPPAKISKKQWLKDHSKEIKTRIITLTKIPFRQIAEGIKKIHGSQIPLKLKYIEFVLGMIHRVGHQLTSITKISGQLFKLIQNTMQVALEFILKSKFIQNCLNLIKLFTISAVPFALYDIASNFVTLIKGTLGEKFDALMLMIADCGIIGECVATFAIGLQKFGALSVHAVQWTTPVFAASLVLSISTVIFYAKESLESAWVLRQLCKKVHKPPFEAKTIENYHPLYEYLRAKNPKFMQKHFKVDPNQLQNKLREAWKNAKHTERSFEATQADKDKALNGFTKVVKNLKMQKIARTALPALLIVSCVFGIAAGFVILFTPAAPVAYGLMIGSVGIAVGSVILGAYCNGRFKAQLGIVSKKGSIRLFCERKIQWLKRNSQECLLKLFPISRRKRRPMPQRKYSSLSATL